MFGTLMESAGHPRQRGGGGTMTSVVVHAGLIAGAVYATGVSSVVPVAPPTEHPVIWVPARMPPIHSTTRGGVARTGEVTVRHVNAPPVDIRVDLPPIAINATQTTIDFHGVAPSTGNDTSAAPGDAGRLWFEQEVDIPATYLAGEAPRYPDVLRSTGLSGHVLAQFVVDTTGRVRPGSVHIIEATHPLFAQSVTASLASLRFAPARVGQRAVPMLMQQSFRFTLEGGR